MIKTIIAVFLLFVLKLGLVAQDNKKEWTDGRLSWQDFSEWDNPDGITEFKYYIGYHAGKQKFGDTTVLKYIAKCYMDKKLSWVNPQYKTEQYLRYNQVIFDIVEIYRRKLQYELDRVNSFFEIDSKLNPIFSSCAGEIDDFAKESDKGGDVKSITFWEQKTSRELKIYPDNRISAFETRNFGYAMHAGFGSGVFTGSLGEHFTPSFNFIFGFDIAFKKSILFLNGTLAGDRVKSDYLSDISFTEGQHANVAIVDLSYGYALIDNSRIKISPFAGLGITEFSRNNEDETKKDLTIDDYNVIFGLNADYKIRTRLKFFSNSNIELKEKVETSVRARLYITKAYYSENLNGYSVNLTIGLCGFGNMIKLK